MGGRGSIEIAVTRDGNGLAVTIADHGAGIPDDLRQRVFEPYFTTKNDGTGLGLALVRQNDRSPQRQHHSGGDAGRRRYVRHRAVRRVSPRVLLVDDEANIRKMVAALLESEGFETAEAANGSAGVAEVERDAPDAVLLDLMMAGGPDGLATLEQLKRIAARPAGGDDERQGEPRRCGAGDQAGRVFSSSKSR